MISKVELQSLINKYYLNGLIEAVKWEIKNNNLTVKFTAPTREMVGELTYSNFPLEDSNVGIINTSQLLKLINITAGDVMLSYIKNNKIFSKLVISDNQFTTYYTLADILTIPKSGEYNGPDVFDMEMTLNKDIINSLIKAKSALPDSSVVVLKPSISLDGDFELELSFGGDIEYSNKVSYFLSNVTKQDTPNFELHFNSDNLKEILSANKEADEAKLFVNLQGLMKLEFKSKNTQNKYYLVQKEI